MYLGYRMKPHWWPLSNIDWRGLVISTRGGFMFRVWWWMTKGEKAAGYARIGVLWPNGKTWTSR